MIRRRLTVFADLGIGTLRTGIGWRGIEAKGPGEGITLDRLWFEEAQRMRFRFKMVIGSLSAAPGWFLALNPDAAIRNQRGETIPGVLSPWWPGLPGLLAEKTDQSFAKAVDLGLLSSTDSIISDLGPAAEPIYPASLPNSLWYFDRHAKSAFVTAMIAKYEGDLPRVNHTWATNYVDWADITLPVPPTRPGRMWEDILTWYRDSKRDLIMRQIKLYTALAHKYAIGRPFELIIFLPGQHLARGTWAAAVAAGDGPFPIEVMEDTEFLLDTAKQAGCWLQITGCEVIDEDRYIQNYLRRANYDVPVWGENAGGAPADNPAQLARAVILNGLYGLEYIDSHKIVNVDGSPLYPNFANYAKACQGLLQIFTQDKH
jgi:hypothetical protein